MKRKLLSIAVSILLTVTVLSGAAFANESADVSVCNPEVFGGTCSGGKDCPSRIFTDVAGPSDWSHAGIDYAVKNNLFNGVGNGKFAPNDSMTRAMLVTVLWRYEGSPTGYSNSFRDVKSDTWYTDAVSWAASKGIVNGMDSRTFAPNANVTREQMVTILYRYAGKKGYDVSNGVMLAGFDDFNEMSEWSLDSISWAFCEGIVQGTDTSKGLFFYPKSPATRAQVAAVLMRYIEEFVKKQQTL